MEIERHLWVQVADGPVWIDYLPALGGGTLDPDLIPKASETSRGLPADLLHTVTIRLVEVFG